MQISPFLNGNVLEVYCFCDFLVNQIGYVSHVWFMWEPWSPAGPCLIAQLSLFFLSYVFLIDV